MKIAIGSDHAGFEYKEKIKALLAQLGHEVKDFGTHSNESVDYPVFIRPVAESVARGEFERGIVLGGSGNGEAIVANKVKGIRCGLCWNTESAKLNRQHNDANMLSLGQRMMSADAALEIVKVWLEPHLKADATSNAFSKLKAVWLEAIGYEHLNINPYYANIFFLRSSFGCAFNFISCSGCGAGGQNAGARIHRAGIAAQDFQH